MSNAKPAYLNVLIVQEFQTNAGRAGRSWTKVGVAFPHADGGGFNIELKAFPRDGKLVVLPPQVEEQPDRGSDSQTAVAEGVRVAKPTATKERAR